MRSNGPDRERFPGLKDRIGEDPARFLDHDLIIDQNCKLLVEARIRGIDKIESVRAWIAVERRLDRGPRDWVINQLEQRERDLEEIGERPDRLEHGPWRPPEMLEGVESDVEIETEHPVLDPMAKRARTDGGDRDV